MPAEESAAGMPRRAFLAAGLGIATVGATMALAKPAAAAGDGIHYWRFCNKCFGLLQGELPVGNHCPQGGSHVIQGWTFAVAYLNANFPHEGETPSLQSAWQQCYYCGLMHYVDAHGVCVARGGGSHSDTIQQNLLPHDLNPIPGGYQSEWRFCFKCAALYFDGYRPNRGVCPGNPGWGHAAAGYMFQLQVSAYT